jgi:hypothetical protein
MALTLARIEGAPAGGHGLTLFYVETKNDDGTANGILVNRLKDKLGTRKVPTAELTLEGAFAVPVTTLGDGTRAISPMLNITRLWNSVAACAGMRRGLALARDYASRRFAFGATLAEKPLHLDTLAGVAAEFEAALQLTFRGVELLGKEEAQEIDPNESELLRLLTPIIKLTTGKQAVQAISEIIEAFGGAGYVEDTGLPRLLRDAQVLPIWEGTTNVLALDALKVLAKGQGFALLRADAERALATLSDKRLERCASDVRRAFLHVEEWLTPRDPQLIEASARRCALTIGRAYSLALLCAHAEWSWREEHDGHARLAALRYAQHGVDQLIDAPEDSRALALDV